MQNKNNIDLTYFYNTFNANYKEMDMVHNYVKGEHEMFHQKIKQYPLLDSLVRGVKSNICKQIVDIIVSRLEIDSIKTDNDEANDWLNNYFTKNRMKSFVKNITRDAILFGSGYCSLWLGEDNEVELFEKSPYSTLVHYDGYGKVDVGVSYKTYRDVKNLPHTVVWVYYPDVIYKSEYEGEYFQAMFSPQEEFKNPFGVVPLFLFNNSYKKTDMLNSEIKNIIPLQRCLNKFWEDLNICSHLCAFPQKVVTGIVCDRDLTTGKIINPFESDVAKVWVAENSEATFSQFEAADLSNYTQVIDEIHKEISAVSGIPQHLFSLVTNTFPSGEALRLAESPLNSKIEDKKVILGDVLEDIFKVILEYKGFTVDTLDAVWVNKEPYSDNEKIVNASNKIALGIDPETVLSELGYEIENRDVTQI